MKTTTNPRILKIVRNINNMDLYYEYSDDSKVYNFWRNLRIRLQDILKSLSSEERKLVTSLCDIDKRKYFNLI